LFQKVIPNRAERRIGAGGQWNEAFILNKNAVLSHLAHCRHQTGQSFTQGGNLSQPRLNLKAGFEESRSLGKQRA
jgi:hypothetical protein